jgi:hypothetical protein
MDFSVTIRDVPDHRLGPLLAHLETGGWRDPEIRSTAALGRPAREGLGHLPSGWRQVRSLEAQTYRWPNHVDHYDGYVVYEAATDEEGTVQIGLGDTVRPDAWSRDRRYRIAFLSSGTPQRPLVEFLEADPADSGEMLAIIRGHGGAGSRKMFGPGDTLPSPYPEAFRIELYRDRIEAPGSWSKLAVVVGKEDRESILNHALLQARRRGDV